MVIGTLGLPLAGGLCNAVHGAVAIGGKAFGMFLRNQRQWLCKPMKEKDVQDFKMYLKVGIMVQCLYGPWCECRQNVVYCVHF